MAVVVYKKTPMAILTIHRKLDFIDMVFPFTVYLNEEKHKIGIRASKSIKLDHDVNTLKVKYLYFKTDEFQIHSQFDTEVVLKSCIDKKLQILVGFVFITAFVLMLFDLHYNWLNDIVKFVALAYFSILAYFSTFGHKRYIGVNINYKKEH